MVIHPTASIASNSKIGNNVSVGAYSIIGENVTLENDVTIRSHVVIEGHTVIGEGTDVFQFASVGSDPQDLKYKNEPSHLKIGKFCKIREHVTINTGTHGGGMLTEIGNNCLLMVGSHIAHDCRLGNHVILVNGATLAGHTSVGDFAIIGGLSAIHQFVRVGEHAFVGGMSGVENDVIPYGSVIGNRAKLGGLNLVGLRRRNFSKSDVHALRNAYAALFFEEGSFKERVNQVAEIYNDCTLVQNVINFIQSGKDRSICMPR